MTVLATRAAARRPDAQREHVVVGCRIEAQALGEDAPAEVEAALTEHPAVAEALVRARPDPEWGEAVVATVVLAGGARATEEELREHCRERLAGFARRLRR